MGQVAHLNEELVRLGPMKDKDQLKSEEVLSSKLLFWKPSPDPSTPTEESQEG